MEYNQILDTLYSKYYSGEGFSDVTSSHWRGYGAKTTITRRNQKFDITAYGISNFEKKSILRSIKHLPIDFLLSRLLKEHNASEETIACAKSIASQLNCYFSFDHAKHVLSFDLIASYDLFRNGFICVIGDGHGFFGTLIKKILPDTKIIFINLGRNLLIDAICFSRIFPDVKPLHLQKQEDLELVDSSSVIFLEAEHCELIKDLPIGIFANIASMQEMDMSMVKKYFEYMRTSTKEPYLYCCNREEKTLPDGSVIRFADYPWGGAEVIVDELCPWYQQYPTTKPPFWRPFEGALMHRLVKLDTTA
jgi:hypothetical protein